MIPHVTVNCTGHLGIFFITSILKVDLGMFLDVIVLIYTILPKVLGQPLLMNRFY